MASWNQTALHLSNLEVDLGDRFRHKCAAVQEAQKVLCQHWLVPGGAWQLADSEALVHVVAAEKSPQWAGTPWDLAVTCNPDGMWMLTRALAPQFPTIVNELGFHNMSVERALRAANDLLSRQGWVTLTVWTATAVEPLTLSRQAWHPAQAATDPSAIRPQGDSQCAPTA